METKCFNEKYVVLEKAEEGSYGAVYKGRDRESK
jgi:cell division cycle 2-like protein